MDAGHQYHVLVRKDGRFFAGYCQEIPQAVGQGDTAEEAIEDTKKAIILCRSYLEDDKDAVPRMVTVTV